MYYIHKNLLGTENHMLVDTGNKFTDCLFETGLSSPGTLSSFCRVLNVDLNVVPDDIAKSLAVVDIPESMAGLTHIMRPVDLAKQLSQHREIVGDVFSKCGGYVERYIQNIATLNSCLPMKFKTAPEGVQIDSGSFARRVVYDTSLTKTGRMKVVSGPNVLTLKKEFKQLLCSRHNDGLIVELDFSALEPRTALAVNGKDFGADIYSIIGDDLGINDRNVAKQVIISFLYGAGVRSICRLSGIGASTLEPKLKKLKKIFMFDKAVAAIRAQCTAQGYFYNHAGRPIFPASDKPGLLFNNFAQSSAVDTALSGFASLFEMIREKNLLTVPICFIHDAVLLDVPCTELEDIKAMSAKLPTYLGIDFPTKLKVVNN